jgi:LAO/AO transport system kinase
MTPSIGHLAAAVGASGPDSIRAAARLMTILEDEPQRLPELFRAVAALDACKGAPLDCLQPRLIVGITGAPGCGKSTLTDGITREYRLRHPGFRVGVVAVDPSSPFTGGAFLGDRVRMMRHATDPMVFVRSMATRGHLGGLTLGVRAVIRVMALLGCDVVIVETAGVGQSEVEVAGVADLVTIVLAPGQGDSIQLLKAGLLEIGDLFVVNKADRPDAAELHAQVLAMLKLDAGRDNALVPGATGAPHQVAPHAHLVSASTGDGIGPLIDDLERLAADHHEQWTAVRRQSITLDVREAILEEARRMVDRALGDGLALDARVDEILRGDVTVGAVAQELIRTLARGSEE